MTGDLECFFLEATQNFFCELSHFKNTIQISSYKKMIKSFSNVLFLYWPGGPESLAGGVGKKSWCSLVYLLVTYLPILDFDQVLLSLKTQQLPGFSPNISYSRRKDNHNPGPTKIALPFSMGWGAINCLGFLLGPEREFRESLPSVPREATGELGGKKREKNSDQSLISELKVFYKL